MQHPSSSLADHTAGFPTTIVLRMLREAGVPVRPPTNKGEIDVQANILMFPIDALEAIDLLKAMGITPLGIATASHGGQRVTCVRVTFEALCEFSVARKSDPNLQAQPRLAH
jgi:hypothetical protein